MNNFFFLKLAASNVKKNGQSYIPYTLSCIVTVAMFYIIRSLSWNPGLKTMAGGGTLGGLLAFGCGVVYLFACVFLFYANSFLIKKRKKEFGVFYILGMEKRHLTKVIWWETVYIALISLGGGLLLGIALDKAMYLLILKMLGVEIKLGFYISGKAIQATLILFSWIFLAILLNSVRLIWTSDPIKLLQGGNVGEKEPKTKLLSALLGAVCLGGGYYLALTVQDPVATINLFFIAVVPVIIGTYLLFSAGSIVLLKLLRKDKGYYYQTRHFISISGMLYRMKQNGVGLANICILSTAVLIMISSTSALMLNLEEMHCIRYPNDFAIYTRDEDPEISIAELEEVKALQKERGLTITNEVQYAYFSTSGIREGNIFQLDWQNRKTNFADISVLIFVPLEDYNAGMNTDVSLEEREILIYGNRRTYEEPTLKILDKEYRIKETLDTFFGNGQVAANVANGYFIVLPGDEFQELRQNMTDTSAILRYYYGFDTSADKAQQTEFYNALLGVCDQARAESKAAERGETRGFYGGFFFLGVFLGTLFVIATALIIYYKQISEGYEDRERFQIMRKVGMTDREVKESIHSQVLTMFFLPPVAAGIHTLAAYPMLTKMMAILQFFNTSFYQQCLTACFLAFMLVYYLIYLFTARTYYKIVSK